MSKINSYEHLSNIWVDFTTHGWRETQRFGQYMANNYDVGDLEVFYIKDDALAFNMIWDWLSFDD